jgi:hypothetical protein
LATSGVPIYKVIAPEGQCIHENQTCDPEVSKRNSLLHLPQNSTTFHVSVVEVILQQTLGTDMRKLCTQGESGLAESVENSEQNGEETYYYLLSLLILSYIQEIGMVN